MIDSIIADIRLLYKQGHSLENIAHKIKVDYEVEYSAGDIHQIVVEEEGCKQ